jgi:hypothetical protein
MSSRRGVLAALVLLALLASLGLLAAGAAAEGLSDDGGAEWRVEQPEPPKLHPETEQETKLTPIGLGRIGDIEFWAPNRGALITAGNGSTVPAGVWFYNGAQWRELSNVCGASDGRIAWAGENEFWTVSNGRPGQAVASPSERPPLEDDTLCHFAPPPGDPNGHLEVVASYASPAFLSTSYQPMQAAGCISASDCWFAGAPLESPQIGTFQLHWNGDSLQAEPYLPEGDAVEDMREYEGKLYEGARLLQQCGGEVISNCDRVEKISRHPPALRIINGEGAQNTFEAVPEELPLYGEGEFFSALNSLHLSANENSLWGAAGPELEAPASSKEAGVTVVRYSKVRYSTEKQEYVEEPSPAWTQLIGPCPFTASECEHDPPSENPFPSDVVQSIAAEPATNSAWIALDSEKDANAAEPSLDVPALIARVSADGAISDELELPSSDEPYGHKGAAEELACPAIHDCWLATTHGWLLHLSTQAEREQPQLDSDPVFSSSEPIAVRPHDLGLPQEPADAPPVDDSGLEEATPPPATVFRETAAENRFATVTVPLLSHVHSRLLHRTTLELSFHLAVKARVRLLAKRHKQPVGSTPTRTLDAGNRKLLLRLSVARWPTKLELQTHALAPLPTASTREAGTTTVTTSLVYPNTLGWLKAGLPR